jgi:hypothetical protein
MQKRKRASDAIRMLRTISERTLEINAEVCICFIDWQKAFERVNWTKLMHILKGTGMGLASKKID